MNLQPLTDLEQRVLGALCKLADEGRPVVGMHAAERLGVDRTNVYKAIGRLQSKGWIASGRKVGYRRPLSIVARPHRIAVPPVDAKPAQSFEHRHPDDRPATRSCLTCGNDFESDGWGNRLCRKCRKADGGPA